MNKKSQKQNHPQKRTPLWLALAMIAIYCVSASYAKSKCSAESFQMLLILLVDALIITGVIFREKLVAACGLSAGQQKNLLTAKPCIFALGLIALPNLIIAIYQQGTRGTVPPASSLVCGMIVMSLVGYLEEVVFRGLLFNAIEKDSLKEAVIITSLTFGLGHLANLFTGQNLLETLLQIAYALCIGYAFVIARIATGSLWPCILVHALVDVLSIFICRDLPPVYGILGSLVLIILSLGVAFRIQKSYPDHKYF